ncbi:MAG: PLDc N-terminal domain-containing protein [Bacteroidales bacterium]|nr:PLDc N-terminal domain-containing protein [Bacteroidales bacterium]
MLTKIVYFVGLVLAILAVIDISKKPIKFIWKIVWSVLVLAFSWIGLVFYYLIGKDNIAKWCK